MHGGSCLLLRKQIAHSCLLLLLLLRNQVPAKVPRLSEDALRKLAEGFSTYKNLPLTSSHSYWTQLIPRCGRLLGTGLKKAEEQLNERRCYNGLSSGAVGALHRPDVTLLVLTCSGGPKHNVQDSATTGWQRHQA